MTRNLVLANRDGRWPSERHPAFANALDKAFQERDTARDIAARLEQELAEVTERCLRLCHEWTRTGSMLHAAQLAEALELGAVL